MKFSPACVLWLLAFIVLCLTSCRNGNGSNTASENQLPKTHVVISRYTLSDNMARDLPKIWANVLQGRSPIQDSIEFHSDSLLYTLYAERGFRPYWSEKGQWKPQLDSLRIFFDRLLYYGLLPAHYPTRTFETLWQQIQTSEKYKLDALRWSLADLVLSESCLRMARHLKLGRLPRDSTSQNSDSVFSLSLARTIMDSLSGSPSPQRIFESLEPRQKQYDSLKQALEHLLDSVKTFRSYTFISFPAKGRDSMYRAIQHRFYEEGLLDTLQPVPDTLHLKRLIRQYQKAEKLKETGVVNLATINRLNSTPWEKVKTLALNLDRCKQLPDSFPERFIWVNIPSFYLEVWAQDTLVFKSRTVVGKQETSTPQLTSRISNMVTYPQWNIPVSIIKKEILPGLKKDPDYLDKHGYLLLNRKGDEIDPRTVRWKKFKETIPYKVIQGSGDENALGILKFNFNNPFSVYMHDTNQRYLFGNTQRSLSHGCVRVQEWKKLAHFLLQTDSTLTGKAYEGNYPPVDSLQSWILNKQKQTLPLRGRIPVYFRYFTCEVRQGLLRFYEDIYGLDNFLKEAYFTDKMKP